MSKKEPLPDPRWIDEADRCLRCDYDLAGISAPGLCPECGLAFDVPILILAGVPSRGTQKSAWRKWAWLGLGIGMYIAANPILVYMLVGLLAYIVFTLTVIVAATVMVWTSRGDRVGSCEIVFTISGFEFRSLRGGENLYPGQIHEWVGDERVVVRRVGSLWARLDIKSPGRRARVLRSGVRLPTDQIADVIETIQLMVSQSGPSPWIERREIAQILDSGSRPRPR